MSQTIGHGSKFEIAVASTLTPVAGVTSISFGSDKIDAIDNTDLGTAGTTKTFTPGMENPGDVSLKLNVIPADASQLALFAAKGIVTGMKVIYPLSVTASRVFDGIITSIDEDIPDDKLPTYTVKIQITGSVTRVG